MQRSRSSSQLHTKPGMLAHTPVILVLGREGQEDRKFKVSLSCIVSSQEQACLRPVCLQ